jgi:hypothetical protein
MSYNMLDYCTKRAYIPATVICWHSINRREVQYTLMIVEADGPLEGKTNANSVVVMSYC